MVIVFKTYAKIYCAYIAFTTIVPRIISSCCSRLSSHFTSPSLCLQLPIHILMISLAFVLLYSITSPKQIHKILLLFYWYPLGGGYVATVRITECEKKNRTSSRNWYRFLLFVTKWEAWRLGEEWSRRRVNKIKASHFTFGIHSIFHICRLFARLRIWNVD